MKRPGYKQRSARPVKPFTIRVVEFPDEADPAPVVDEKRGRGRPPTPWKRFRDQQVAMFIHVIERLAPSWKNHQVQQALHEHGLGVSRSTFYEISEEHPNLEQATEITLDAQDPMPRWLWSFLMRKGQKTKTHPHERRVRELMRRWTITTGSKIDPKKLDLKE